LNSSITHISCVDLVLKRLEAANPLTFNKEIYGASQKIEEDEKFIIIIR
jgi:hypothetical protein